MLFSEYQRYQYARSPLIEVICQLRFPAILTINNGEPADFQEAIRQDFPRYAARQEQRPPKIVGAGGPNPKVEPQPPITNHNFVSADGLWKINLTKDFIALSTLRYTNWEDFALRLDKPLPQFIQVYKPAFFQRVGLRYLNAVSKKRLGLTDLLWDDLIRSPYLGILGEPDVDETKVGRSSLDTEIALEDGIRMKVHAGPGLINGGKQDPEPKFILDGDFSRADNLAADKVPGTLEELHRYAERFFHGAIMPELHEAMGPTPIAE